MESLIQDIKYYRHKNNTLDQYIHVYEDEAGRGFHFVYENLYMINEKKSKFYYYADGKFEKEDMYELVKHFPYQDYIEITREEFYNLIDEMKAYLYLLGEKHESVRGR